MSKRINGTGRNAKGEDWGKMLKELQSPHIQAILSDNMKDTMNRAGARAKGFRNKGEALDQLIEKEKAAQRAKEYQEHFRALKMGEWWRDTFEKLLPKWAYKQALGGSTRAARILGYQWGSENGEDVEKDDKSPLGYRTTPYSKAWITRKRFWFLGFGAPVLCKHKVMHKKEDGTEAQIEVETWFKFIWEA